MNTCLFRLSNTWLQLGDYAVMQREPFQRLLCPDKTVDTVRELLVQLHRAKAPVLLIVRHSTLRAI